MEYGTQVEDTPSRDNYMLKQIEESADELLYEGKIQKALGKYAHAV